MKSQSSFEELGTGFEPSVQWTFIPLSVKLTHTGLPPQRLRTWFAPIQVVRRSDKQVGFVVLARRWVVERFFARINRNRRLAKDVEASIASAEAFLYAASSMLLLRRIAR